MPLGDHRKSRGQMSKNKKIIRFGIKSPAGFRSSTWNCNTRTGGGKPDFYLTCRALKGALKTSMHLSWGWWQVAFEKPFIKKISGEIGWTRGTREIEKWPRPAEIAPGITLAYRLVIPESALTIQGTPDYSDKDIVWLPAPPKGMAVEISFLLTTSDRVVSDWPGKRSMNTELIGTLLLENAETLWLVHRVTPVPQLSDLKGQPTWFNPYDNDKLPTEGLRAIVFGTADDGSKFLFETAVVRSTAT